MEVTLLRLPNMDIVINGMEEEEKWKGHVLRKSSRIAEQKEIEEQQKLGMMTRRRRMRYNSLMDEDEKEDEDQEDPEQKRKEPDHRRLNRLRNVSETDDVINDADAPG